MKIWLMQYFHGEDEYDNMSLHEDEYDDDEYESSKPKVNKGWVTIIRRIPSDVSEDVIRYL